LFEDKRTKDDKTAAVLPKLFFSGGDSAPNYVMGQTLGLTFTEEHNKSRTFDRICKSRNYLFPEYH
jgi:hypothetical protein